MRDDDDPTGVDGVVRRIEDAGLAQSVAVTRLCQLVVCRADDGGTAKLGNAALVQAAPKGTWRQDVAIHPVDVGHVHALRPEVGDCVGDGSIIGVGDDRLDTLIGQPLRQAHPDLAHSLDCHPFPGEIIAGPQALRGRPDRGEHPPSRSR